MRPGALFVGALAVFALLGLLAGRDSTAPDADPGDRPARTQPRANKGGPEALARRWGRAYATWRHDTLAHQLAALAGTAGQSLQSELRQGVRAIRRDASLARDGAGSRGSVRAVQLHGRGARRRLLVVTRETPYVEAGTDLQGARYRVYTGVVVEDSSGRWFMQSWDRQP